MTDPSITPVPGGVTPVGVQTKTAADRASAQTAMSFERLMLGELTKSMADPKLVAGGDDADGATQMLLAQMPDVLADSLSASGGIGLAAALQPALEGKAR